jgi:poly(3-hydroxybutyrate) depolymerase
MTPPNLYASPESGTQRPRHSVRRAVAFAILAAACTALFGAWRTFGSGSGDIVAELQRAPRMRTELLERRLDPEGRETQLIQFSDGRDTVLASIRIPPSGPNPVPAVVVIGGARTARHAVDLVDRRWPYAVAALDYATKEPLEARGARLLLRLPRLRRQLLCTAVAMRDLARFVASDARVDRERVYLVGASLGSPLATATAAAAPPAGLALLYGFADHTALVEYRLRPHVGSAHLRRWIAGVAAHQTAGLDAARNLPRLCGTPVLVVTAPDDVDLPPRCTAALWAAACEPRRRVDLSGGHIRGARDSEILQQASSAVATWLADLDAKAPLTNASVPPSATQ